MQDTQEMSRGDAHDNGRAGRKWAAYQLLARKVWGQRQVDEFLRAGETEKGIIKYLCGNAQVCTSQITDREPPDGWPLTPKMTLLKRLSAMLFGTGDGTGSPNKKWSSSLRSRPGSLLESVPWRTRKCEWSKGQDPCSVEGEILYFLHVPIPRKSHTWTGFLSTL